MKIYNIYPTNEAGVQIGSAIFQGLNKKIALATFDNLDTYSKELSYRLVERKIYMNTLRETYKTLKVKNYNP